MKKCGLLIFTGLLLSSCSPLLSSIDEVSSTSDSITVVFEDNEYFSIEKKVYSLAKGDDLFVHLDFQDGYSLKGLNYQNYSYDVDPRGDVDLWLKEIEYSIRIQLEVSMVGVIMTYHLNGGSFFDESKGDEESFSIIDNLANHHRPNVSIGTDVMYRDGYVQVGWNTKSDGSGMHVGLGSRVTVENGKIDLYAEWVNYTKVSSFKYEIVEDGYKIVSFSGPIEGKTLCIPQKVGGKEVVELGENLFWNIKYERVILPPSIKRLNDKTFANFEIQTLTIFDNIQSISDASFNDEMVHYVDIQACIPPRFLSGNDNAQFSEDMDRLILAESKKKMVFFAGCSMSYGLCSPMVDSAFPEYDIFNMGVIGGVNALFQLNAIRHYLKQDDVFIHAPEEMSYHQHLNVNLLEMRVFVLVEANYDLLQFTDFSSFSGFFDAFFNYNELRFKLVGQDYGQFNNSYNQYGDIIISRPNSTVDAYFGLETCFDTSLLNNTTKVNLNNFYSSLRDKGVTVCFSYAPINSNAVNKESAGLLHSKDYELFMKSSITKAKIISDLSDYIMPGQYFFDTDYHLSEEGARIRTNTLIKDIEEGIFQN